MCIKFCIQELQLVINWRDTASGGRLDACQRGDQLCHHPQGVRHLRCPHAQICQVPCHTCCPDSHDPSLLRDCSFPWRGRLCRWDPYHRQQPRRPSRWSLPKQKRPFLHQRAGKCYGTQCASTSLASFWSMCWGALNRSSARNQRQKLLTVIRLSSKKHCANLARHGHFHKEKISSVIG